MSATISRNFTETSDPRETSDRRETAAVEQRFEEYRQLFEHLRNEIGRRFVGQPEAVERLLVAVFSRGHVLIEGMPGLGKTVLVKTLAQTLDLTFSRVQCTPDLMPADIIGTHVLLDDGPGRQSLRFHRGPIFSQVVLADEVNRATPKTQSAFLEAMQERRVTAYGRTLEIEEPFLLFATQNPIEVEGTYPLPEAQLDRFFFKLEIGSPTFEELSRIVELTTGSEPPAPRTAGGAREILFHSDLVRTVKVAERVRTYALRLVLASHPEDSGAPPAVRDYVRFGASPRAAQSLILGAKALAAARGRFHASIEDVRALAEPALIHRVLLSFEAEVSNVTPGEVVQELVERVDA